MGVLAGVAQWLGGSLQIERSLVRFLVRAHAWVAGQAPSGGVGEATDGCFSCTLMFLSPLSPSLPFSLKINKNKIFKKNEWEMMVCKISTKVFMIPL